MTRIADRVRSLLMLACLVIATGCATPAAPPVGAEGVDMETAARLLVDTLGAQLDRNNGLSGQIGGAMRQLSNSSAAIGSLLGRAQGPKQTIAYDPMIDGASGQRTSLAVEFEKRLLARFATARPELTFVRVDDEQARQTDLLMVGSIALDAAGGQAGAPATAPALARVALMSRGKVLVVAQSELRVRNQGFDLTPQRVEQDSPVVMLDPPVKGYLRSASTPAGQAPDTAYTGQIGVTAAIQRGADAYNAGRYADALKHFDAALAEPSGEQARALNGSYLSNMRLGRTEQGEQLFGRIVALGLNERKLAVKFLFNPGTTDFWTDPQVSGPYAMWLRQIARGLERTTLCADVVGHASRTGAEAFNARLSEQRAELIRRRLATEAPALGARMIARGVGSRETIVGTGTDDARDAVDRRVAFGFRECR